MWNNFYTLVTTAPAKNQPPLPQTYPYYVLVEALGGDPEKDHEQIETALGRVRRGSDRRCGDRAVRSPAPADLGDARRRRNDFRLGMPVVFDVSMRISKMEAYVDEVTLGRTTASAATFTFGHMGDGNLHFVIAVGRPAPRRARIERSVYEPLAREKVLYRPNTAWGSRRSHGSTFAVVQPKSR